MKMKQIKNILVQLEGQDTHLEPVKKKDGA